SIKEDFRNHTVSNRGGTTTCPTNQRESNIVERKETHISLPKPTKTKQAATWFHLDV
ncbi:1132_t:CDS:1, partial [Dentiscutata erythropus]